MVATRCHTCIGSFPTSLSGPLSPPVSTSCPSPLSETSDEQLLVMWGQLWLSVLPLLWQSCW